MELAKKVDADIIVGTDPDADRVGAVVKKTDGDYMVLTGNMTGALLCEYILSQKKANGTLPVNGAVVSTIVSTDMTKAICTEYGMKYFDVLTGLEYIGEKIKEFYLKQTVAMSICLALKKVTVVLQVLMLEIKMVVLQLCLFVNLLLTTSQRV